MARSAILSVRILGDARSAVSAMRDTERESSRLGGALRTIGGGLAAGAAAIGAAAAGVGAGLGVAITKAADLEQSVGAIDTVFGEFAGSMHSMSATAATDVGLTKNEFNELGTLIGTQLKNGGTAMSDLAPKTNELIGLGADLASMFGGTTSDAVASLSSALKGERDPIERYGVSLTQAAVDAKAAELGFQKVGGALSAEANQAATLALIMEQTSAAHGNFAKESNTFSGQLERMRASWGNIVTTVGTAFLPMMTAAATAVNTHVLPAVQAWADSLGEGSGLGAALQYVSTLGTTVIGSIGTAFQVAGVAASQFAAGWAGMTAGVIGSGFMGYMVTLGATVRTMLDVISAVAGPALQALGTNFAGAAGTVLQFASTFSPVQLAFDALLPVLPVVGSILGTVAGAVLQLMAAAIPLGVQLTSVLVPVLTQVAAAVLPALLSVVQAVVGVLPAVAGLFGQVAAVVVSVIAAVAPLVTQLVTGLAPIMVQLVQSVLPPVVGALMAIIPPVLALVQTLVGALVPAISALLPIVTTVFSSVAQIVTGVMQVVSGVIQTVMGVITGDWGRAWTGVQLIVSGAWQAITGVVTAAVGLVAGIITAAAGVISTVWQALWGGVAQFLSNTWNTVVSTTRAKGGELLDFIGGIPDRVMGLFRAAGSWLIGAGEDIINGLLRGAGNILPSIGRFFLDKVPAFIREPFKQALGIHSPSRVFARFGANIGDGLVQGVDGSRFRVRRAGVGIAEATHAGIARTPAQVAAVGVAKVAQFTKAVTSQAPAAARAGAAVARAVRDGMTRAAAPSAEFARRLLRLDPSATTAAFRRMMTVRMDRNDHGVEPFERYQVEARQFAARAAGWKKIGQSSVSQLMAGLTGSRDQVVATAARLKSSIFQAFNDAPGPRKVSAANARRWYQGSFAGFVDSSTSTLAQLARQESQIRAQMRALGSHASAGLVQGLRQKLADVEAAASQITGTLLASIRHDLLIQSPSRVMAQLGRYTAQGLAVGIRQDGRQAISAVRDMARSVLDTGSRALGDGLTLPVTTGPAPRMQSIPGGRAAQGSTVNITVNVEAGVGDPVEIGREVDRVLRRYRSVVGEAA